MRRTRCGGIGAVLVALVAAVLLASVQSIARQGGGLDLTVEAPASLAPTADRVRRMEREPLNLALARAGLELPPRIRVTLIAEDDARARAVPPWVVGLASGQSDVVIFSQRIGQYPYDSLESVVWHEVVHLALTVQAGSQPLPRWFHEGVAMSIERGWGVTSQARLLFAAETSTNLADLERLFNAGAEPENDIAYLLAAALVSDLQRRYGAALPGAIVDRVAAGADFAEAFAEETGETPDEAASRAWRVYRRWTGWIPTITSAFAVWIGIMLLAAVAYLVSRHRRSRRRRRWDEEERDALRPSQGSGEAG